MAKKKSMKSQSDSPASAPSLLADEAKPTKKGKRGFKECPSCHKLVGARNTICPECNAPFPPKGKKGKAKAARKGKAGRKPGRKAAQAAPVSNGAVSLLQAAGEFIRAAGSVEQAEQTLAALKNLPTFTRSGVPF